MSITKTEADILLTIVGCGGARFYTAPRPYTGIAQSSEHRAANKLASNGLCVVSVSIDGHTFTARSIAQYRELLERLEAA